MKEANFPRTVKEIKFGAWSLNPKLQMIYDGEVERELEPLLFKILSYLIINKDEIITRQDLIDDVWCQHYVDDNAINRAMSELRKVLKSEIQRGLVVKTHYRKGYSFFLEPEVIYYEENTSLSNASFAHAQKGSLASQESYDIKPKLFSISILVVISLAAIIFYSYINFYKNHNIKSIDDTYKADIENINVVNKEYKEETLSWMQGKYTEIMVSPISNLAAFSFIKKEGNFSSLMVKNLTTGQENQISELNANVYPVGWSSSNNEIIYRIQNNSKCEVWSNDSSSTKSSKFISDCQYQSFFGTTVDDKTFVYSKYGYRGKEQLSVIVNRNLITGAEFQISSPNLSSFGDKFLHYIKSDRTVIFERNQLESSELFITDLEGGNQTKLYSSKNRIWAVNYFEKTDILAWFDNVENTLYNYSLLKRKITRKISMDKISDYSSVYPISETNIIAATNPYVFGVYRLDLEKSDFSVIESDKSKERFSVGFRDEKIAYLTHSDGSQKSILTFIEKTGEKTSSEINNNYKAIRLAKEKREMLVLNDSRLEIIDEDTFSVIDIIEAKGTIVSAEYINKDNIAYVIHQGNGKQNLSYVYNRETSNSFLIPIPQAIWLNQLPNGNFIALLPHNELHVFDSSSGKVIVTIKLNKLFYRHSLSLDEGKLIHSNGRSIYLYNFEKGFTNKPEKIYDFDSSIYVVDSISYNSSEGFILMDLIKNEDNRLVMVSAE
jgi:DNA-binding winged helix-turn-helix (wHTH) protein